MTQDSNFLIYDSLDKNFFVSPITKFSCIHLNIRSLRQNFNLFVANLSQLNYEIDIIVLTEIWIFEEEISFYKIPGYTSFANCNEEYRSGGIITFIRDNFDAKDKCIKMQTVDILVLEFQISNSVFNIFGVYRLQNYTEHAFIDELEPLLNCIVTNTIFLGDINICIKKDRPEVESYLSLLYNNGFVSLINSFT